MRIEGDRVINVAIIVVGVIVIVLAVVAGVRNGVL